jgi:hypothetical protein
MFKFKTLFAVAALTVSTTIELNAQSGTPAPPPTGPRSVQMFQGKTQNVWLAVYPPTTYSDGTPIKDGTPVKIKVHRSYDGGKTFKSRVTVVSGGSGFVGQGKAGSKKKPWIDMKVEVPVDNKAPYLVVLGISSVVGKKESAINTSNLTFRYYPSLQIFGSPAEAVTDEKSTPATGQGPLHGNWDVNGQGTLVINEKGNKVTGTITASGQQLATLSGTRSGNRYSLSLSLTYEGKTYPATVVLNVANDGKSVTGTANADGESIPLSFKINGRKITTK